MNQVLTGLITASGGAIAVKILDIVGGFGKNKTDRTTSRETLADGATKTAIEALQKALDELRRDVDGEKGKRVEAELSVETLKLSVEALAERIEEQNRELADQPKLKAENQRLRRQVNELQKQVGELKSRIRDLEQTREERVVLETEMLRVQITEPSE